MRPPGPPWAGPRPARAAADSNPPRGGPKVTNRRAIFDLAANSDAAKRVLGAPSFLAKRNQQAPAQPRRGFGRRAPLVGLGHNSRRMHSLKGIVPEVAAHVSVLLCAASGGGGVAQPYEPTAASTCDGFGRRTPFGFISP